jgi:hypothetical protein
MPKGLPISFRLDDADKQALDKAAADDARSVSSLLTLIVRQWLADREAKKASS